MKFLFNNILLCSALITLISGNILLCQTIEAKAPPAKKSDKPLQQAIYAKMPQNLTFFKDEWIYYLPANTTQPKKIAKGTNPTLAPDGVTIAYNVTTSKGDSGLSLINAITLKTTTLLPAGTQVFQPQISPDGKMIVYSTMDSKTSLNSLSVINIDGSKNHKIITASSSGMKSSGIPSNFFSYKWMPDSKALIFQDLNNYYIMNLEGKILQQQALEPIADWSISSADPFVVNPANPDEIAYTRGVEGTKKFQSLVPDQSAALYLYNVKTKSSKRLTPANLTVNDANWSANGKYIYFNGYLDYQAQNYGFDLYRINSDGTGLTKIGKGDSISL